MWRFRATQKSLPSLEAAIFQAMKVAIRRVKQHVMTDLTNNMTKQSVVQTAPEILKSTPSSLHHITLHMALSENRLPQNVIFCWGGKPNISIYIWLYIIYPNINHPESSHQATMTGEKPNQPLDGIFWGVPSILTWLRKLWLGAGGWSITSVFRGECDITWGKAWIQ